MDYKYLNEYDDIYEDHKKVLADLKKALEAFKDHQREYKDLVSYYYSESFSKDLDKSNKGEIPDNVKQAILTEDAIYDLMGDNYYMSLELLDLANEIIQDR